MIQSVANKTNTNANLILPTRNYEDNISGFDCVTIFMLIYKENQLKII